MKGIKDKDSDLLKAEFMSSKDQSNDEDLMLKTSKKDVFAFEELVKRYQHKIINLIYKYVNNSSDAEDLAQEVFLIVWKSASGFRYKSKFSTWLYKITVNTCLNYKKKKEVHNKYFEQNSEHVERKINETSDYMNPATAIEDKYISGVVRRSIDELPPKQKIALILCSFEGHSYKEISEIMDISVSAVESVLFRAKQNIKDILLQLKQNGEI